MVKGKVSEVAPVGVPRQETVVVVGRVRGVGRGWEGISGGMSLGGLELRGAGYGGEG